jgi:hypothetical protein
MHIARASHRRQQDAQRLRRSHRSNFVDRMMDEVVRSTPSSAPMRSMT